MADQDSNNENQNQSSVAIECPRPALERASVANEMLAVIASCGRRFFSYQDRVSRFDVDARGRVWLTDKYTQRRIYTHYKYDWRGFSDGGTLRALIERLRDYIQAGKTLPPTVFGPWPEWVCGGDLWGYGADMETVRRESQRLGLTLPLNEPERETEITTVG